MGGVYQGRYKSFPVQDDAHFTTVLRYVERNPVRAGLARRAQDWPWSSASAAGVRPADAPAVDLARWPVPRRPDWLRWVNAPQTAAEEGAVRRSIRFARPLGSPAWVARMERRLGLPPQRPRGRPRKHAPAR